jgi:hypothetical protein
VRQEIWCVCVCVCACACACVHADQHKLPRYTIYQQNVWITTYNEKSLCRILHSDLWRCVFLWEYMVWQFNSWNGPVKVNLAYLCTSGCCCLRNTLLLKLCTSSDDGATAGNRLENRFLEYLTVTFSRCVGCQKGQQIFVPRALLKRAKNRRELSQVNKVDGPFL